MERIIASMLVAMVGIGCSASNNSESPLQSGNENQEFLEIQQSNETNTQELLQDREWVLFAYSDDRGIRSNVIQEPNFQFTMRLASMPEPIGSIEQVATPIFGVIVCKSYFGAYSINNNILETGDIFMDDGSCQRDGEEPSRIYGTILFNSPMLSLDGEMLVLTAGSNESLIFRDSDQMEFMEILSDDLASLGNSVFPQPRYQVLRNQNSFVELYSSLIQCPCSRPALPQVNFDTSTVLFLSHEIVGTGGSEIGIAEVTINSDRLVVDVQRYVPGSNCEVTDAPTGPFQFYRVNGVHENVDFVERPVVARSCE